MRNLAATLLAGSLLLSAPAHAELAPPMRSMLDSAIASGSDADIDTIAKYLKQASPADAAEIDKTIADHRAQIAAAKQEKLAHQGLLDGWHGEGQIGFSKSGGNTSTSDISLGVGLTKEGLRWRYKFAALADYQHSNGVTTGNQQVVSLEPDYKVDDRLFVFGLAEYERNRFAGFSARDTLGGGIGYRAVATPSVTVDLKAGPTWRKTSYIGGPSVSAIAALGALDATWKVSAPLLLSEDASVLYTSQNTAINSLTALTAKLSSKLSARASFQLTDNSNPPPGFKKVDTLTRFTLVYGF